MIEKVARAICEVYWRDVRQDYSMYENNLQCAVNECWECHIVEARAAIEAMREPSEDMLTPDIVNPRFKRDLYDDWTRMINKALEIEDEYD